MPANEGVILIGSEVLGYTERTIYVKWDIAPDLRVERFCYIENPYYLIWDARFIAENYILHTYTARWIGCNYKGPPITERKVLVFYGECRFSVRTVYYFPDTSYRYAYAESIYTTTPLLLKYPKYYNWNYIPQVLSPEFRVWAYYPIVKQSVTLKLLTDRGKTIVISYTTSPDKVEIVKESDKIYKITFTVDEVFDPGEKVDCYLSLYDIKGNYLKDGLW